MLLILGNGFDVNLGLPTRYSDFLLSIKDNHPFYNTSLYKHLKNAYDNSGLNEETRWLDLENELKYYILHVEAQYIKGVNYHSEQQVNPKYPANFHTSYLKDFYLLTSSITQYLKEAIKYDIKASHAASLIGFLITHHEENFKKDKQLVFDIITFNYTSNKTIRQMVYNNRFENDEERLYNNSIKIHQIHGNLETNNVIVGIESNADFPPEFNFLKKGLQPQYPSLINIENLLQAHQEIHFYGFSIGETDAPYFRELFDGYSSDPQKRVASGTQENKTIIFYHYGTTAYDQIITRLDELTDKNVDRLRQKNNIKFKDIENYKSNTYGYSEEYFHLYH